VGTVISIDETWESGAGWTHTGEPGSGNSTATRKFKAVATADTFDQEILLDNRVPQVGAAHPWNSVYRCRGTDATRSGPLTWDIVSNYDSQIALADGSDADPLDMAATIRIESVKWEGEIDEDINGTAIATVLGEPIYGVTKTFADLAISITKNVLTFAPLNVMIYADTVNSAPFLGFAAGTLKLDAVSAETVEGDSIDYWRATATVTARRIVQQSSAARAWWKRVRHEGFKEKPLSGNEIVNAIDSNGDPVSRPVLLDADGRRVTDSANAHWLEFQVYQTSDFNNLISV